MKIYAIREDVSKYQQLISTDTTLWETGMLFFECKKKNDWPCPVFYIDTPLDEKPNFYNIGPGVLAFDEHTLKLMDYIFEKAGEILPITTECGQKLWALNVLECANCIDTKNSKWLWDEKTNQAADILKYAFHEDRLGESSIFKVPETHRGEILTFTGVLDKDEEFFHVYHYNNLKGLIFDELWSS